MRTSQGQGRDLGIFRRWGDVWSSSEGTEELVIAVCLVRGVLGVSAVCHTQIRQG